MDARKIADEDLSLLQSADIVLADISRLEYQYVGCIFEIVHAHTYSVPIVLVVGNTNLHQRVFFQAYTEFQARTMDEAISYIWRVHTSTGYEVQKKETEKYFYTIAFLDENTVYVNDVNENSERGRKRLRGLLKTYMRGRVLEVASGNGSWTQHYTEGAQSILCLDRSESMLRQLRERVGENNKIETLHCDVFEFFRKKDQVFDNIVLLFLLSLLPFKFQKLLLVELRDLLKPGGLLLVADTSFSGYPTLCGLGSRRLQMRIAFEEEFTIYKELFTVGSLASLVTKTGYQIREKGESDEHYPWIVAEKGV